VRRQDCWKDSNSPPPQMPGGAAPRLNGNGKDRPEAIGCMLMGNPEQRRKSGRVRVGGSLQTRGEPLPLIAVLIPLAEIAIGYLPGVADFLLTCDTHKVILIIPLFLAYATAAQAEEPAACLAVRGRWRSWRMCDDGGHRAWVQAPGRDPL
jgi:hypothetical protein